MAVTRADGNDFDAKMSGADLNGKVHHLAALDANGALVLATAATTAVYGIITEDGVGVGVPITVQYRGLGKAKAGGAINEGDPVTADNSGLVVAAVGGAVSFGMARNAAASGEMVEILIDRGAAAT